jgi:hypothetical protein
MSFDLRLAQSPAANFGACPDASVEEAKMFVLFPDLLLRRQLLPEEGLDVILWFLWCCQKLYASIAPPQCRKNLTGLHAPFTLPNFSTKTLFLRVIAKRP